MLKKTLEKTEVLPSHVVRAPHLARLVRALFSLKADPTDRRARITMALLEKEGAACCPACELSFSLDGYTKTTTGFSEKETLACRGCRTVFLLSDREIV